MKPLTTRILDSKHRIVNYSISEVSGDTLVGKRTDITIWINRQKIGYMQFSIQKQSLYIHRMDNFSVKSDSAFKYVGSLLFEYAFQKSIAAEKEGRIELQAIEASPGAYYKMGLRRKSSAGEFLETLIFQYLSTDDENVKQRILIDDSYEKLLEYAALKLQKEKKSISFAEAIEHGFYDPSNFRFADFCGQKSADQKITDAECYSLGMQGTMYLPKETIKLKMEEFARFVPIGGNLFFSYGHAQTKLQNTKLKELVEEKKLDPSNAIEIEAKIEANDARFTILVSPIGLEMLAKNYISGWYVGVYLHHCDDLKAIVSRNGLEAFEQGFVNVNALIDLGPGIATTILSNEGMEKFRKGELRISEEGYHLLNAEGKQIPYEELNSFLGIQKARRKFG